MWKVNKKDTCLTLTLAHTCLCIHRYTNTQEYPHIHSVKILKKNSNRGSVQLSLLIPRAHWGLTLTHSGADWSLDWGGSTCTVYSTPKSEGKKKSLHICGCWHFRKDTCPSPYKLNLSSICPNVPYGDGCQKKSFSLLQQKSVGWDNRKYNRNFPWKIPNLSLYETTILGCGGSGSL